MRHLLSDRTGSLSILLIGLLFGLLLLVFLVIEMGGTFYQYEYAQDVLQRAANSAVEKNIDDAYRADRILLLKVEDADRDFRRFASEDLPANYTLTITRVTTTASPPALTATGTVSFPTVFSQYGFRDLTFSYQTRATNYDLD